MEISDELRTLAQEAIEEVYKRDLTIAIAEECTGGLISTLVTEFAETLDALLFSVVVPNSEAKEEFLGLPTYIFTNFGAVSMECTKAMAESLLDYDADIGLAITGILGEGKEGKLKGTAYAAVAVKGHDTFVKQMSLNPTAQRFELKILIAKEAFDVLRFAIKSTF
ncbi:MAG: CinA family protein [Candidatus Heimdallarchaeota archaeon]